MWDSLTDENKNKEVLHLVDHEYDWRKQAGDEKKTIKSL